MPRDGDGGDPGGDPGSCGVGGNTVEREQEDTVRHPQMHQRACGKFLSQLAL
jgi:hypothetical protein